MTASSRRPEDEHIVAVLRRGSGDEAIRLLLDWHGGAVKGALAQRFPSMHEHDLEQAIHDGAIRIWQRAREFDPTRGTLRAWLLMICKNYLFDQLRLQRTKDLLETADFEFFDSLPLTRTTPSEWASHLLTTLRSCIERLSPMQQDILLSGFAGTDADDQQIASRWNTTANTIRVARFKVRPRLGQLMRDALR